MTMLPADGTVIAASHAPPPGGFEKTLRIFSVITMLMTVPQVLTIWVGRNAGGYPWCRG